MFFIKGSGKVFHRLNDLRSGSAPQPCGAKLDRYSLMMLNRGEIPSRVLEERPPDGQLCKHCEKAEEDGC